MYDGATPPKVLRMSRTHYANPHRHLPSSRFWRWRDLNRQMVQAQKEDAALAAQFDERAAQLAEQVQFLAGAGLTDGARAALASLAEQDMADFCILVDLADPGFAQRWPELSPQAREALAAFVAEEPWRSLIVDHDITIALALLDEVCGLHTDRPWYDYAPGLAAITGRALNKAHTDQLARFVGEFNVLAQRDDLQIPADFAGVLQAQVGAAASRLGQPSPTIEQR